MSFWTQKKGGSLDDEVSGMHFWLSLICRIIAVRKEVDALGGSVIATRGGMIHLILTLCRQFEDAFVKAIDGGKGGA